MDAEEFIEHHGIKGQKWGQRLYQYADGSLTPLGRIRYGSGQARSGTIKSTNNARSQLQNGNSSKSNYVAEPKLDYSAKARSKNISEMSDQELNAYVNRIRLEQTYAEMMAKQQPQKGPAARFVASTWKDVASPAIKNVAKQTAEYGLKQAVNKLAGEEVFKNNGKKDKKKDDDDDDDDND